MLRSVILFKVSNALNDGSVKLDCGWLIKHKLVTQSIMLEKHVNRHFTYHKLPVLIIINLKIIPPNKLINFCMHILIPTLQIRN